MKKKWFVVYTLPRWEKKVSSYFQEKNITFYCPINKVKRKWKDRLKTVEEPLFKSYVFVNIDLECEQSEIRTTPGVKNFVYWLRKPAVVKDSEIDDIKFFLEEHENVQLAPLEFKKDQQVKILSGLFVDKTGTIVGVKSKTVKIAIESLGCYLVAEISKRKIIPIKK